MVSKQRRNQERYKAVGLCPYCRSFPIVGHGYCFRHWILYHLKKSRIKPGRLIHADHLIRELLVINLYARYHAIQHGLLQPIAAVDLLPEAVDLRLRIGMGWGGVPGAQKLAKIIGAVERKAVRTRGDNEPNQS